MCKFSRSNQTFIYTYLHYFSLGIFFTPSKLSTAVTELVQVLSPLIQQTQKLTEAVGEHLHLTVTLSEFVKSQEVKSLAASQQSNQRN